MKDFKDLGENTTVITWSEEKIKEHFGKDFDFMNECWAHYRYGNIGENEIREYYIHDLDDKSFESIVTYLREHEARNAILWIYRKKIGG